MWKQKNKQLRGNYTYRDLYIPPLDFSSFNSSLTIYQIFFSTLGHLSTIKFRQQIVLIQFPSSEQLHGQVRFDGPRRGLSPPYRLWLHGGPSFRFCKRREGEGRQNEEDKMKNDEYLDSQLICLNSCWGISGDVFKRRAITVTLKTQSFVRSKWGQTICRLFLLRRARK